MCRTSGILGRRPDRTGWPLICSFLEQLFSYVDPMFPIPGLEGPVAPSPAPSDVRPKSPYFETGPGEEVSDAIENEQEAADANIPDEEAVESTRKRAAREDWSDEDDEGNVGQFVYLLVFHVSDIFLGCLLAAQKAKVDRVWRRCRRRGNRSGRSRDRSEWNWSRCSASTCRKPSSNVARRKSYGIASWSLTARSCRHRLDQFCPRYSQQPRRPSSCYQKKR